MKTPVPDNEAQRLASLRSYEVLDTIPEQAFDDLTLVAAQICQVPMAQVSFVDQDRQWFKSRIGVRAEETSRDIAFCSHTILHADQVLEVRDASLDPRFADNPLVTSGDKIRFYAGAPLVAPDGHALGALCVMDSAPRKLSPEQVAALQALSRRVVAQLELRRHVKKLAASEQEMRQLLTTAERSRRALLGVLEDEKQAMQSLRASEERFRQMADTIDEVFWLKEVEEDRIIYINPAYERIWGRRREELYASAQAWSDTIHEDDRDRVIRAAMFRQLSGGYDETYRIVRPDGDIRWVRSRAFPVRGPDGHVRRVVGVAEDITERKRLEEQFLHAQRMEAIGTLAGGVAHDLNNILSPVLMAAGLLKNSLTSPQDVAVMGLVETSAQRGAAIIRQLLTFSRGLEGERGSVQLKHLVKDMVHIMQETFPRNISVDSLVAPDLWCVLGDATQMHQVLLNLCVNARDAMPEGGKLTLRAENVQVEATAAPLPQGKPGPHVAITVSDTGTGIPPGIIERIFDPFFTTKEVGKGTGLGLSTVMGIVKGHGGFVTVQSEPGKGTAFKVHLPATDVTGVEEPARKAKADLEGHDELILVVDDEEAVRLATCYVLADRNYRVLTAENGEEAVRIFLENQDRVRLVLTDVMMPVMGGLELARALRSIRPHLPIVATTGLDQEGKMAEFAQLGVTDVLLKPCVADQLLAAIRQKLDRVQTG